MRPSSGYMQRIDWSVYQFSVQGLYSPRQSGLAGYVATTLVIEGVSKAQSSSSGCVIRFSLLYGVRPRGTTLPYILDHFFARRRKMGDDRIAEASPNQTLRAAIHRAGRGKALSF